MRGLAKLAFLTTAAIVLAIGAAGAQSPTGTISGRVTSPDGQPLLAVAITLESASLQQPQSAQTTPNGDYIFKFLPPGTYTVSYKLPGFSFFKQTINVGATQPVTMDIALKVEAVTEEVTVTANAETFTGTSQISTNLKQQTMAELPTSRSVNAAVDLAPSVHATGPGGAVSMGGAMSYSNSVLVNGVQIQDNLRGTPLNLYIEDAIQETTVTTGGASAEWGRYSGGVVNALTKSGGDIASGSFRTTVTNDAWRTTSPFGEPKGKNAAPAYEFTFGGPAHQGKTWFFLAGRTSDRTTAKETGVTGVPYDFKVSEQRYEGKLTQTLGIKQRVEVDFTNIGRRENNFANPPVMDKASLTNRSLPQNLTAVHYTGALAANFFLEAQFSARNFAFEHDGGTSRDLVAGTPILDQSTGASFWAPWYCGVCGSEQRDNSNFVLKGTYFLSTGTGAHNMTFGYDMFNNKLRGDNHQSGSDYHVWSTASFVDNNTIYPVFESGFSTYIINWPITDPSHGSNFRTHGLFLNDAWSVNRRVSVSLGARYDRNRGRDGSGHLVAKDGAFSPRLGVVWDPAGDGRTTVDASWGRYVDSISSSIASHASAAGLPAIFAYFYQGPDINVDPSAPLVPTADALRQVFDWYAAAAPDPFQVTLPGVDTVIRGSLKSPHADEAAVGVSRRIGRAGTVRVDAVSRTFADFYAVRADMTTGQVTDSFGQSYDLKLVQNSNQLTRRYAALNAQGSYRVGTRLNLGASYTLSRLHGNVDGENSVSGPLASDVLSYPEYSVASWNNPQGDLSADQRHRARVWGLFNIPVGDRGNALSLGFIEQMQSGTPYGAVGSVLTFDPESGDSYVQNPGYQTPPQTMNYYFSARDAFHTAAMFRTDLSLNYTRKLGARRAEAFLQFQALNVFNQFQLFNVVGGSINTVVVTAADGDPNMQPFNPFTDTPVQGVNWRFGKKFGKPTAAEAYTLPRTYSMSVGFRF